MFGGVEVNENARRLGIGTRLFKDVISDIHYLYPGKELVAYTVDKNNTAGIEFYKSLGAEIDKSYFNECCTARFRADTIEKIYEKNK